MTIRNSADSVYLGTVRSFANDGSAIVNLVEPEVLVRCVVLESAVQLSPLEAGDTVVVLHDGSVENLGVILGRRALPGDVVRPALPGIAASGGRAPEEAPDTLVLEATREMTLRVGDGSITIRKDGKILIKGTDLVSHAKRMNRVKGGAVSIN